MLQRAPSAANIIEAAGLVSPAVRDTPALRSPALDEAAGATVFVKDETSGPIGSFKARGTDYLVAHGVPAGIELVCASAGNFGQGLALSGTARGHKVTVFAATSANPFKVERMRALGADVKLAGDDFDAANAAAKAYAAGRPSARYIEDCELPEVAEGAGTIARELTEAGLEFGSFFVPVGGGALANGIGTWLRHARPGCKIVGVSAAGAPAYHNAWRRHQMIATERTDTIADGIAVGIPMAYALEHLRRNLDEFVLVTDEEMLTAMRLIHKTLGLAVEPSSASVIAAMLKRKGEFGGRPVATLLSGGNLTAEQKRAWLGI